MAEHVYPKTLEAMWGSGAGAVAGTVKAVGVQGYTYSDTHDFYDDVSAAVVSDAVTVGSKAFTNGSFTGAAVALTGVANGDIVEAVITFVDTGTPSTSRLLTYTNRKTDTTDLSIEGDGVHAVNVSWPSYIGLI